MDIYMSSIGIIRTPYKTREEAPRSWKENRETEGEIIIDDKYVEGIASIEAGKEYYVLFYFHESKGYTLTVHSHRDGPLRSLFATRSPDRPNGIGLTIITVTEVKGNRIRFTGVDMLDGTPVLDIKPNHDVTNKG